MPSTNTWVAAGTCPVQLHTSARRSSGPALRIPDGRIVFIGGTNNNAIYNPATNAWAALADTPGNIGANDAPGAMLPNGHILYAAGDTSTNFSPPTSLFDMDPVNNTITAVSLDRRAGPLGNARRFNVACSCCRPGRCCSPTAATRCYAYNPDGTAPASIKPVINNIQHSGSGVFTLTGTQLNGVSEGASYGDDAEMSSNYPIVRFIERRNRPLRALHDWSSTGVATGSTPETMQFEFPAGLPAGTYQVQVIANGIASDPALDTEGTSGNDTIVVKVNGTGTQVDVNGVGAAFSSTTFNGKLFVHAGFGNDSVAVNSASALNTLQVDTSIGNDVVTVEPISVSGTATVLRRRRRLAQLQPQLAEPRAHRELGPGRRAWSGQRHVQRSGSPLAEHRLAQRDALHRLLERHCGLRLHQLQHADV